MESHLPNSELVIDVKRVGRSREPVLIIDDFLADPWALVAAAEAARDWKDMAPGGYPGRRAALPGRYVRGLLRRLDGMIRQRLIKPSLRITRFTCAFSMVTRCPESLSPLQRVPHIDVADPNRVAVLHYLCGPGFGGTAFYRQEATGLEQVRPSDRDAYLAARKADLSRLGPVPAYPGGETPGYTRTGHVEARFNRVVLYRSFSLHSGIIPDPDRLSTDPAQGRLTTTLFVDYGEAGDRGK